MKPNVGDVVDIDILSEEEKTGNLVKIHKRKNQLIRPMAANVDQALVIFAVHEPEPNFHLLNRFLITMEQQEIPVIICFNKTDLATTEQMQQLEKDYENSGCQVIFQAAATGEGITQIDIKQVLRQKAPSVARKIPGFMVDYLIRTVHQDELNEILRRYHDKDGVAFMQELIGYFDLNLELVNEENIPAEGRYKFASNHQLGGLAGI